MTDLVRSTPLRYGGAAVAVLLAMIARLALDPILADLFPFATLFLAVLVVAGYAGRGPALLTVVLGAAASARFLLPPRNSLAVQGVENQAGLVLYMVVGVGIALLGGAWRAARRRAEDNAALVREHRALLRATLQSVGDGLITTDANGRVVSLNPIAEAMTGWGADEAKGLPLEAVFRAVDEDTRQPVENPALRALEEGRSVGPANHTVLIARDGTERPVEDRADPIRDAGGEVSGVVLVFRDVSERRDAEEALRERERQLRFVTDHAPVLIAHCDPQRRYKFVNRPYAARFGLLPEDFIGKSIAEVLGREAYEVIGPRTDEVLSGRRVEFEADVPYAGLGTLHMRCTYEPEFDAEGRVVGLVAAITDDTERERAERALREAETRLSAIVDHCPATIFLKDREGRYLLVNRRFEELARLSGIDGPYPGKTDAELLPPDLAERFRRDDLEVLETGQARVYEESGELGGEWRTGMTTKFPLLDETGHAYAVCGISLDVTEPKRAEERVRFQAHLLDAVGQAVIATDPQGQVLYWNRSAETLFGWAAVEATGRNILDLVVAPESAGRAAEIMGLLLAGEGWSGECTVRRRDGTTFPAFVMDTPVFDDRGALEAIIGVTSDISERKRVEERLRESERRFARFMQHLPGLAWIKDVQGRYVYANDAAEMAFRTPRADLYGKTDDEIFPPETAAQFREHDQRALAGGAGVQVVETLEHQDGSLHHSLVTKFPMPGPDDEVALIGGMAIDITDRMRAEEALREGEGRFRGLMEQAPFSIQIFAPDGTTLRVNRAWEELWGVKLEQIPEYNILEDPQLEAWGALDPIRRAFAGVAAAVPAIQYDPNETIPDRTRHKDPRRWVSAVAYPLKDAAGRVKEVVLVHEDITERMRAEEELRMAHAELETRVAERTAELARANEFLRALLESIQDGIVACDADGILTLFNRATIEFHGLPPEPLSADCWAEHYDLYRGDGRTRMSPEEVPLLRALRGERVRDVEMVIAPRGGPRRTLLASGQAFHDDRGRRLGAVVSMHDISERKHAEGLLRTAHEELERRVEERTAELARANDSLQEADRRKDEFLATLAHELRNPLAPIRNALHLMGHPTDVGRDFELERAMAERQVVHLARLIDDLMDVARISRGKIELRKQAVDLATVVGQAVETARPLIDERRHDLGVALPGGAIRLEGDPTRLEQVLWNLLNNAAKYTDPGGHIELRVEPGVGEVAIRVRDTGIGIARESLPHIFDMFVQVDHRTGRSQGGLGIGLGLVKTLVEMHGGTITASSDGPGQGSEFTVRLPVIADAIDGRARPEADDRGRPEGVPPRRRILVADDNIDAANSLARLLRRLHGQDVRVVHDGPEALAAACAFLPEVALLDIGMPGMDGYEVARRLRANPDFKGLLLVALTGWGQEADRRRSEEAGFDRHLIKPVDPEVVRELLVNLPAHPEAADPPRH